MSELKLIHRCTSGLTAQWIRKHTFPADYENRLMVAGKLRVGVWLFDSMPYPPPRRTEATIEITFNDGPGALKAFLPYRIGVKDGITMWLPPGSVVNQFFSSSAVMIDGAGLDSPPPSIPRYEPAVVMGFDLWKLK